MRFMYARGDLGVGLDETHSRVYTGARLLKQLGTLFWWRTARAQLNPQAHTLASTLCFAYEDGVYCCKLLYTLSPLTIILCRLAMIPHARTRRKCLRNITPSPPPFLPAPPSTVLCAHSKLSAAWGGHVAVPSGWVFSKRRR